MIYLKKSDNNISSSNTIPGKLFWGVHSDVISNKVPSLPVVIIPNCLINNSFAVESLQNNDSFVNIVNNRAITKKDDVDIPQNKDVDILSKNNNQPSVPVNIPPKIVSNQFFNSDKDVGIPNVEIPKKNRCRHTSNKDVEIPFSTISPC